VDGAHALLLLVLFFSAGVLMAGIQGRCPACRKLFVRQFVRETVIGREDTSHSVSRSDAALNFDRLTGTMTPSEPIHVHTETFVTHYRCAHCWYEWTMTGRRHE
jgi:hypothetical protein